MAKTATLTLLLLLIAACGGGGRPSVLLIVIDTLRADHVHCLGYEREITPTLDSLAAEGVLYTACQSQSTWTLPAMASLLTGTTERTHGAGTHGDSFYGLTPELATLAGLLGEEGYSSFALFNAPVMNERFGFARDFQNFDTEGCLEPLDAEPVVYRALQWLDGADRDSFFMFLHFFDPHYPYAAPGSDPWLDSIPYTDVRIAVADGDLTDAQLKRMVNLYDVEINYCDDQISDLMAGLRDRGLAEQTVVVVVADHGEEFLEHGRMLHGQQLFQETIHVPMIITGPGVPRDSVVHSPVGLFDVMPTVLHLCGLETPAQVQGVCLLDEELPTDRGIPSSGTSGDIIQRAAMRFGDSKALWDATADSAWMYDLSTGFEDPDSTLLPDSVMVERLCRYWASPRVGGVFSVEMEGRLLEELKDLGYI
mgnify:CR=1 FL=1